MDFLKGIVSKIEDVFRGNKCELTAFQRMKLADEFHMFYDVNKDGNLTWKDMEMAKNNVCKLSGWKEGSKKYMTCHALFVELWRNLQDTGDADLDGQVSEAEWFELWTKILKNKAQAEREAKNKSEEGSVPETMYIPAWFHNYVEYKFNLYDRAGDGVIDCDEFEYTLSHGFEMNAKDCRAAFNLISQGGEKKVDLPYFRQLATQFYLSDNPGDLGTFINGKLVYE